MARTLLTELHARALTAFPEAAHSFRAGGRDVRLLQEDAEDPVERTLAWGVQAADSDRAAVAAALANRGVTSAALTSHEEILGVLAAGLIAASSPPPSATPYEHHVPVGFR